MRTIRMSLKDENAGRPVGNPFPVKGIKWKSDGQGPSHVNIIKTGISLPGFSSCHDLTLSAKSLVLGMSVLSTYLDEDEVCLLVWLSPETRYGRDDSLAEVTIYKAFHETIRFVEERDGKRVIVGGPETVDA